ncbi:hypothetical protein [Clostridium estertheticum]|uniref:hypothetical protein n=1 Tax=Clostridium estertheticum TaxID=238834 RepID=UPI001C7E00F6|nr:hypothetical protein [Clostridium estertheticum]MBX4267194.1 hypothetical protein [Clostridium estertheticum]MBX4272062.1 hypothetical protein [Clostridium estertheticum]WLC82442.1 hypothetical protein KTC98_23990 [Clostridium estertheticum]WLC91316.1 hypothetical protein KTC95_23960 [Clostridium estertheticum]
MYKDYINVYAFNDKEKEILNKNENVINEKVKLSSKDVKVYFLLKKYKEEICLTDLVRRCLREQGYDVNEKIMFKPRKRPNGNEFYETGSFWGYNEYRIDTFSRSLSKLIKVGLVKKRILKTSNTFKTVVTD